jgi:hypothetical protein
LYKRSLILERSIAFVLKPIVWWKTIIKHEEINFNINQDLKKIQKAKTKGNTQEFTDSKKNLRARLEA